MTKLRTLTLLLGAALVASCGDPANQVIGLPEAANSARIRFFNFGVSAPGVHFFANDQKLVAAAEVGFTQSPTTGVATGGTESVTGIASGGAGNGGLYSSIPAGSYAFNARIAAATDNGLKIASVTQALEAGKKYSFFISGVYDATAKTADAFIVEDPYQDTYDWSNSYVRFVNAGPLAAPQVLYVKNQTTAVETPAGTAGVAYKGASAFVSVIPGTYDFRTTAVGGATNTVTRTGVTFTAGKYYTVTLRGTTTLALDQTANK